MQDFTEINGATQLFLGTHVMAGTPEEVKGGGEEARALARKGDCMIRDLRLCGCFFPPARNPKMLGGDCQL